jgi:hypothetical protein
MKRILLLLATMLAAVLVASGVALAVTTTFSNTAEIRIRDANLGVPRKAMPYPSEITVSGFSGTIRDVNVILKGFRHLQMEDADVLLVGPEGQTALLMGDVGGQDTWVFGLDLVFDDEATKSLNDGNVTETDEPTDGSYKPTQGTNLPGQGSPMPTDFPSPAPKSPYGTDLSVFDGTDPNGDWKLYVLDDHNHYSTFDGGKINRGWNLRIKAPAGL